MDSNKKIIVTAICVVAFAWLFHAIFIDKTSFSSLWEPFDNVDDAITASLTNDLTPLTQPNAIRVGQCAHAKVDDTEIVGAETSDGIQGTTDEPCYYAAADESLTFGVASTANASAASTTSPVAIPSATQSVSTSTTTATSSSTTTTPAVATTSSLGVNSTTTTSTTLTTVSASAGQTVGVKATNGSVAPVTTIPIPGNTDSTKSAIPVTSVSTTDPTTGQNVVHKVVPMTTSSGQVPVIVSTTKTTS